MALAATFESMIADVVSMVTAGLPCFGAAVWTANGTGKR
jgi:hypothetical protein